MDLGIDLGSSRVVICRQGKGVVLDEPSVIAMTPDYKRVIACGEEAEDMLGRTPPSIVAARPVRNGVIAEYEMAERMLRFFLQKVCSNRIAKPCVAVGIPENVTEVEKRSFIEALISAGARRVTLVPTPIAAALGAGLDVSRPCGQMVVDIGAGVVNAAVLTLKGAAVAQSLRLAGDALDEEIVRYMRAFYGLVISDRVAADVKMTVGSASPITETLTMQAKGRDALTGLPRVQTVTSDEILEVLAEPVAAITGLVQNVLELTPPELAGDVINEGICLTGGMARMRGMAEQITRVTGVPCHAAENAPHCVAVGAVKALSISSSFSRVYDLGDYSYRLSDAVTN